MRGVYSVTYKGGHEQIVSTERKDAFECELSAAIFYELWAEKQSWFVQGTSQKSHARFIRVRKVHEGSNVDLKCPASNELRKLMFA